MATLIKLVAANRCARTCVSLLACALLFACSAPEQPSSATIWPAPKPLPMGALVDQNNEGFGQRRSDGRWQLVFFGFTHCPDVCPTTLSILAAAQRRLRDNGQPFPDILLVSVDPERDDPATLKQYIGNFDAEIDAVTGQLADIEAVASAAAVFFAKSPLDGGDYTVDHSSVVLVVDNQSRIRASFSAPHRVEQFVHDVPLLMKLR